MTLWHPRGICRWCGRRRLLGTYRFCSTYCHDRAGHVTLIRWREDPPLLWCDGPPKEIRLCTSCGDAFEPRAGHQKRCSRDCWPAKGCPQCKVIFAPKTQTQKFCGFVCQFEAASIREKERWQRSRRELLGDQENLKS